MLPSISGLIRELESVDKEKLPRIISDHLSSANPTERWTIIKLATGNLRVGVSERLAKTALALFGNKAVEEIEHLWHGLESPYTDLFAWLEGKGPIRKSIIMACFIRRCCLTRLTGKRILSGWIRRITQRSGNGTASVCSWCSMRRKRRAFFAHR